MSTIDADSRQNEVKAAQSVSNGHATEADLKREWLFSIGLTICPSEELQALEVPSREAVLGDWFRQGDLGFVFGPRGLGKTWLAMHLARQISEGGKVANWHALKPRKVLYVDGEMPLDGIRERDT